MATSIFWFPEPERPDTRTAEFLTMEQEYLAGGWTLAKTLLGLLGPVSLTALALALWRRSLLYALVVPDAIALSKIARSFCYGGESGLVRLPLAPVGLIARNAVNLSVAYVRGVQASREAVALALPAGGLGIIKSDPAVMSGVGVPHIGRKTLTQPQTQEARIKLYTGDYCPYCRRVKKELDRLNLPYEEVYADAGGREEVIRLSGQRAIPILTIDGEVLVDSSYIIRELRSRFG